MLTHLGIENFKSIGDYQELNLTTVNVLIGPNRSGKSSISQAIGLLKQSSGQNVVWNGNVMNLKDFDNILNKKKQDGEITIQFGGRAFVSAKVESELGFHRIDFGITINIDKNGLRQIRFDISGGEKQFRGTATKYEMRVRMPQTLTINEVTINFAKQLDIQSPFDVDGYNNIGSDIDKLNVYNAAAEFCKLPHYHLQSCVFVPTIRGFDSPDYPLSEDNPPSIPTGKGLSRQAEQSASSMAYNKEHEKRISELMKMIFPDVDISHQLIPKRVSIVSEDKFGKYNVANEGFGVNQLCFLFQQLVSAQKFSTVFIEEPEIALHPAAHIDVCNALINEITREPKQLVITTHSEHILLSFLDAVTDGRLSSNQLNVYYFERENGSTKITPILVTEKGGLEGGMKGFFEADMKHLESFLQSMKKQK